MEPTRRLVYDFLKLPAYLRRRVCLELGLIDVAEWPRLDVEHNEYRRLEMAAYLLAFQRVIEREQVVSLRRAVDDALAPTTEEE